MYQTSCPFLKRSWMRLPLGQQWREDGEGGMGEEREGVVWETVEGSRLYTVH